MSLIDIYTLDLNYAAHAALINKEMIMTEKAKKPAAKKTAEKKPLTAKHTEAPKKAPVKKPVAKKATDKPEAVSGITMLQKLASATAEIVKNNPPKTEDTSTPVPEKPKAMPPMATGSSFDREVPFRNTAGPVSVPMPATAVQVRKERPKTTTINGKVTMGELIGNRKPKDDPKPRRPKHNFKFL